jgi:DNA-directed RNA polymerase II subunit RPB2
MYTEKTAKHLLTLHSTDIGYGRHHTASYNHFLKEGIKQIMEEESVIEVPGSDTETYTVMFQNHHIKSPTTIEENRDETRLYPHQARLRKQTYRGELTVDITVIRTKKHGEEEFVTSQERHEGVHIAYIPIMVGCCKCSLWKWEHMSAHEKLLVGECPQDPGGYFIIKGGERVLIPQERANYNTTIVHKQKKDKKHLYVAEVRSMSPTTGHSVLIKALVGKAGKGFNFSLPYINSEIPIGMVFTALGFSEDEICALVSPPCEEGDKYSSKLTNCVSIILRENVLPNGSPCDKDTALLYMSKFAIHQLDKDESKRRAYVVQILENEILPHMGVISHNLERGIFLSSIVRKLLETYVGKRNVDDRDNIANKRVETSGMLVAGLFRALFKRLVRSCAAQVAKRPDICAAVARFSSNITQGLQSCFSTGKWGVQKNSWTRQGVSQVMSRLTWGATASHLRRLVIPMGKEGKNTAIRQLHGSQAGYVCLFETPEGHSSGIVKNLALLSTLTNDVSSDAVRTLLEKKNSLLLNIEQMAEMRKSEELDEIMSMTKVYLNGCVVGVSPDALNLCRALRKIRDRGRISREISISYNQVDDEVFVSTDGGRLSRPLIPLSRDDQIPAIDLDLQWQELVRKGYVKYLCPGELENFAVATDVEALVAAERYRGQGYDNFRYDFLEISPAAMMGVCASIIPYPDHSQSPRNCYQSAMGKQALGVPLMTNEIRADTEIHVLMYPQRPLVATTPSTLLGFDELPSGQNVQVAVLTYGGHNQEDSIIINKSYIDRGGHRVVTYKTTTHQVKKGGSGHIMTIGPPPLDTRKRMMWYGSLDDDPESPTYGVIKVGSTVNGENTVLIGRFASFTTKDGQEKIKDSSIHSKSPHIGTVDKIILTSTPDGLPIYHVKVRYIRIPEVGDKFASREAQKGTCGRIMNQEDMPFTPEGTTPDVIINPHCIPSRMTVNQLIESIASILAIKECRRVDATAFTSNSTNIVEKIQAALRAFGLDPHGLATMTNGMTGERLKARVSLGPVYYQRLKHMVSDKLHARAWGALQTLTRQPLEGRSRQGGLRFGEMERDCMISHGASAFLHRRLLHCSDYFETDVCMKCFQWCSPVYCDVCKSDDVQRVMLPYACKLLFNLLRALGLKTQCIPWQLTN